MKLKTASFAVFVIKYQTLLELSKALNVTPMAVSKCLHAMGKIQEKKKEKTAGIRFTT